MGRELKRVPLNFDWPLDKVWDGYVNPFHEDCPKCDGHGVTSGRQWLGQITQLLLMAGCAAADHRPPLHPWLHDIFAHVDDQWPSPDMAELTTGLAGRGPFGRMGHDAIDRMNAVDAIIKAAGLDPEKWGTCPACSGDGIEASLKAQYDAWEPTEPPAGEGYQLWETTSEGSPISPVFKALDELCEWAAVNATTFGRYHTTAAEWKRMLGDGMVYHQEGGNIFL